MSLLLYIKLNNHADPRQQMIRLTPLWYRYLKYTTNSADNATECTQFASNAVCTFLWYLEGPNGVQMPNRASILEFSFHEFVQVFVCTGHTLRPALISKTQRAHSNTQKSEGWVTFIGPAIKESDERREGPKERKRHSEGGAEECETRSHPSVVWRSDIPALLNGRTHSLTATMEGGQLGCSWEERGVKAQPPSPPSLAFCSSHSRFS